MKICLNCNNRFDDNMERCPQCNSFLMPEDAITVSFPFTDRDIDTNEADAYGNRGQGRTQFRPETQEPAGNQGQRRFGAESREPAGGLISDPLELMENAQAYSDYYQHHGAPHNSLSRRILSSIRHSMPALRHILPILLILAGVISIIVNWESIRAFLSICLVGAVIGGIAVAFLSVRSHHGFQPDIFWGGALIGAVLSCLFTYNTFHVTDNVGALLEGSGPCVIIIIGIWLMFRSVR